VGVGVGVGVGGGGVTAAIVKVLLVFDAVLPYTSMTLNVIE
jgi:hypothetical protein